MPSIEPTSACNGDDEQSIAPSISSTRRRVSKIQDIRTRRTNTLGKSGKFELLCRDKPTVITALSVDTSNQASIVTPTYTSSEDSLEKDNNIVKESTNSRRIMRTSSRTPDCHTTPMVGFVSNIKSSGMKGGARRVVRKVPMSPAIKSTSSGMPGSSTSACVVTPSPREVSVFSFDHGSNSNSNSKLKSKPRSELQNYTPINRSLNTAESSMDISTDAPILNTLSSLSLNDDKRKRLASGPKRIPRQSALAKKSTPPTRLLRTTVASRSKKLLPHEIHNSVKKTFTAERASKVLHSDSVNLPSNRNKIGNLTPSPKIALMDDFAGEVDAASGMLNENNSRDSKNDIGSIGSNPKIDPRNENIRSKPVISKVASGGTEEGLPDTYHNSDEGVQNSDLGDSFDLTPSNPSNKYSVEVATPVAVQIENFPNKKSASSEKKKSDDSFDSVTEHFRKHQESKDEMALRRNQAKSFEWSDGRTNPVAKTLSQMDAGVDIVQDEMKKSFSGGGSLSAFSEL